MSQTDHDVLMVIQATVLSMEKRLFGDGQRGEISAIKARLQALERHRWIFYGGTAVVLVLIGVYGADLLKLMTGES